MPALFYESVSSDYSFFNPDTHLPSPPVLAEAVAFALQKYPGYKFLPSNYDIVDVHAPNTSPSTTHFSCDDFRMYEFKVRRCMRGRSHDWTECPYAHPGEKARRRDPKRIHYSGVPCPDFRKGSCRRGDACEFAHGVFECWLHPARYRTQVCKDGKNCRRRVCFFAHSPEQLRILPSSMASAPAPMHTHTDTSDGSPVGSPRASPPQMKVSSETPTSLTVVATSSVGTATAHAIPPGLSTAALSLPNTFMSNLDLQVSPISLHFDSLNGLPLRRAMAQNFLACKGYGGGSFNLNVAPADYLSSVLYDGGYEGPAGGESAFSLCGRPQSQSRCSFEGQEGEYPKLSLPLGPLDKSKYEFASHGFGSPTSTLAAHAFSPPPLSPPLSPLSSPNSDKPKGTFANPHNNLYVDDTISSSTNSNQSSYMYNANCMEDLAFRLQHLQIPQSFNHPDSLSRVSHSRQSPLESRRGMLEINPVQSSHSRPPSLRHISHGLSCAPRQSMWSPLSDFASCKDDGGTFLHMKDTSARTAGKIYGEESNIDNLIPDVGWVSELVK